MAAGERLALADAGKRAGVAPIKLVELDSAEPDERDWDPDRVAENAGRAADDPAAIAYLGELELGASAVSLPVTNEESILQVSPTDGLSSLTVPQPGPGAGPERFYPEDAHNFLRLVPPDSAQAGPLVAVARESGAATLAIADDGGIFGRQLRRRCRAGGSRPGARGDHGRARSSPSSTRRRIWPPTSPKTLPRRSSTSGSGATLPPPSSPPWRIRRSPGHR